MKSKIFSVLFVVSLVLVFFCPLLVAENVGTVIFCQSIDDKWKPIDPSTTFETNVVTIFFQNVDEKAFGANEAVITVYLNDEGRQQMLHRENVQLNPQWNTLVLQDIPLPDVGNYYFVLSAISGNIFASGEVTIKTKVVDKEIPEKNEIKGVDLKALFDLFSGKAKQ
jgi:hypothetical protein